MTDLTHEDLHEHRGVGLDRRHFLTAAGGAGLVTAAGLGPWAPTAAAGGPAASAMTAAERRLGIHVPALWRPADRHGLVYGSSAATWQLSDKEYAAVFARHASLLFTEDDLLWYRVKPTPHAELDFTYSDQIIAFAEKHRQIVLGAHLVWDEGFGEGWTEDDLWGMSEKRARHVLYDTMRATMRRYRGRVAVWSVVNEAIVNGTDKGHHGLRTDVPWFKTIGPEYVGHAFDVAADVDCCALLMLNDFGYETVNQYGDRPADKQRATLQVIDRLLERGHPVQAFGIQAHLLADRFHERFHARAYRRFIRELADRGLTVLITELDVLDDGLPAAPHRRDQMIADVYRRYLDVTLEEEAVKAVVSFGLSDRYTWLQEDYPRDDGAARRPLAFSESLRAKPAYWAMLRQLRRAPDRDSVLRARRHAQ
jgi:endo-1,4-beta-xylanase